MQTQTPEQQSAMVVSYHMSVSSDNDDLDRPRYATFRGDIWELRREVERLRRACADNGLYAVSILYPSLAVEWHDPRSEFRIESDRLVVNRMGDVRWEGRTRFAGNRMATEYTTFSTLTALAESGDSDRGRKGRR
ncbi:hypothetical protein [Cupriavidus necator]